MNDLISKKNEEIAVIHKCNLFEFKSELEKAISKIDTTLYTDCYISFVNDTDEYGDKLDSGYYEIRGFRERTNEEKLAVVKQTISSSKSAADTATRRIKYLKQDIEKYEQEKTRLEELVQKEKEEKKVAEEKAVFERLKEKFGK